MSKNDRVRTTVIEVIASQLEVETERVTDGASFVDDLGADSLALVEATMAIEEAFEIEIPEEDLEKLRTVGDVIAYVRAHAKE